jgi:DNA-binding response OmpR family regulator
MSHSAPLPTTTSSCLLVDDEDDIADALTYHLTRCGFRTTVSRSLERGT